MTVTFVWSEEDVYFNPKCTNTLRSENVQNSCDACVAPIEVPASTSEPA